MKPQRLMELAGIIVEDRSTKYMIDQLSNSMEHYTSESDFIDHMRSETNFDRSTLKKMFKKYWDLNARERDKMNSHQWEKWIERMK